MKSKQPKTYRWNAGDYIDATEAARLLGYKSSKNLRDPQRLQKLVSEFDQYDCALTTGLTIGGQKRFLRSEFDDFLEAKKEAAQAAQKKRNRDLRIAA